MMILQTNESDSRIYAWLNYGIKQREKENSNPILLASNCCWKETQLHSEHASNMDIFKLYPQWLKHRKHRHLRLQEKNVWQLTMWVGYHANFVPTAILLFKYNCLLILEGPSFPWLSVCSPKLQKFILVIVQRFKKIYTLGE